jgi:hypothetical protein
MSSSAERPPETCGSAADVTAAEAPRLSWSDFPARAVPDIDGEFVSLESELASLRQHCEDNLRRAREQAVAAVAEVRAVIFDLAVHVGRLDQLLTEESVPGQDPEALRKLDVLKNQMLQTLGEAGVELRDPRGLAADEVMNWVEVAEWVPGPEYEAEVVAATEQAAVLQDGVPVRLARVVMGTPLVQNNPQDEVKDEDG